MENKNNLKKFVEEELLILKKNCWIDSNTIDITKKYKDEKGNENDYSILDCIDKCTSPDNKYIFNAFKLFDMKRTRILIIGQDPYPDEERAHGFAFSFGNNEKPADDSLLNIFKAISVYKKNIKKYFCDIEKKDVEEWDTNLENWASTNNVLLLNTALTYQKLKNATKSKQDECQKKHIEAWNPFIKQIISNLIKSKLSDNNKSLAVFLWGVSAQNIFSESLNLLSEEEKNNLQKICDVSSLRYKRGLKFKKINYLLHYPDVNVKKENKKIKLFMTSHPSNNFEAVKQGFCYEAPKHFAACDDFLGKNEKEEFTWKNFPENY